MKNHLQITFIFLFFLSIISCNGQKVTNPPQAPQTTPIQKEKKPTDVDPYFNGTSDITSSEGPNHITRNVLQDREGNFWLATWDGIIRYDGTTFTNFTNKDSLRRYRAFSILEDRLGKIWYGTIGAGIYLYDGKKFTNITTEDGLVNNDVTNIYEDSKGKIWFCTQIGISIYDGKSFTNFTTKNGLINNDVNSIIEDKTGKFWIGARGEASVYDGKTFTKLLKPDGSHFINVRCIIKDKNDNIWLGGNDGLWRFKDNVFTNFSKNFVGYIYEDLKGNIWTSSESTESRQEWVLSRHDAKSVNTDKLITTEIFKKFDMFFGIIEDKEGNIWFGTLHGVYRYDGKTFHNFKKRG